jgi:prostaglandin-endoperoxide synthase 2
MRDTSRDGLRNKIEDFLLTRGRPIWNVINRLPWINRLFNRLIINNAVRKAPFRPLRLSTMDEYPSWSSLTERTWFTRYLPTKDIRDLPPLEALEHLYIPRAAGARLSDKSTLLFPSFAQWFTDGFLMTSALDSRRTTTNHQIDLSQLYGLDENVQRALRLLSEKRGHRGRMLSEDHNGEEWAPRLFDLNGDRAARFAVVPTPMKMPPTLPAERKATLFAFGGERANSTVYTAALNTLFLREHNRLCGVVENANPQWVSASSKPQEISISFS